MDQRIEQAPEISVAEFQAMPRAGVQVVDVREQDEWDEGHIPGAVLIPLGTLEERLADLDPDRHVVVVCKSGGRHVLAADRIPASGQPGGWDSRLDQGWSPGRIVG